MTLAQQTPWAVLLCKFTDTQYRLGHSLDRSMAVKLGASQTQVVTKLYFSAHLVMENRNGLCVAISMADATPATEPGVVI